VGKSVLILPALLAFLFIFIRPVYAARSVTISADKDSLFGDEELLVTATLSGFTDGETVYIKGAFYADGSTNYFGYTKNVDTWIKNGASTTTQKQVKIGEWDNSISVKSDFVDSGFKGEGDYKLKVGFYYTTTGGNLSSVNWSTNVLDVHLNEPDPTPTPSPSQDPTPTPSTTTSKSTASPKSSPKPSTTPKLSPTPKNSPAIDPQVLGTGNYQSSGSADSTQLNSKSPDPQTQNSPSRTKIASIFVGSGLILLLISAGLLFYYKKLLSKDTTQNEDNAPEPRENTL
jgi:hypothetical protein